MKVLSQLVNKALSCDPHTSKKLAALDQKILGIKLLPLEVFFWIEIQQEKINIFSGNEVDISAKEPDAWVKGTLLDLTAAFFCDALSDYSNMENLEVSGDVLFIQDLKKIFHALHIDWQEKLADLTNDHFAYWSMKVVQKTKKHAKSSIQIFMRDLKEYVEDEKRVIVSKDEVNDFCTDVDSIQHAVDRLYARWANL